MTPSTIRLKQLAEAALFYTIETLASPESCYLCYAKTPIDVQGEWIAEFASLNDAKYFEAANPQAVLGLISRIEKLEAALQFYADIGTYGTAGPGDCTSVDFSDCEPVLIDGWGESFRPGKKAREALKEET